jgi:WD40 repeat protein
LYEVEKGKEGGASQANKLEFIKEQKLIVGGCEDGFVRLFDLNSGKIIKKLQAKGSVGSLLGWEWNLIAGDHSGCMNIW